METRGAHLILIVKHCQHKPSEGII